MHVFLSLAEVVLKPSGSEEILASNIESVNTIKFLQPFVNPYQVKYSLFSGTSNSKSIGASQCKTGMRVAVSFLHRCCIGDSLPVWGWCCIRTAKWCVVAPHSSWERRDSFFTFTRTKQCRTSVRILWVLSQISIICLCGLYLIFAQFFTHTYSRFKLLQQILCLPFVWEGRLPDWGAKCDVRLNLSTVELKVALVFPNPGVRGVTVSPVESPGWLILLSLWL